MNRSISEGAIPSAWKQAIITPVLKSGPKSIMFNHRPISILPVFSKIQEKAVHRMVYDYFQTHNILSVHQSGFRPLHSTTTSLTDTTNTVLQNIDKGKLTGLAFLDLTKAFDTLDHDLLLNKLSDYKLLTPTTVHWFRAYLTGRTQRVCINGALSDPEAILYGVPHGSILGHLMFIMYINDLTTAVKHCKVHLYADDALLYFYSSSVQDIETSLSKDLENIVG